MPADPPAPSFSADGGGHLAPGMLATVVTALEMPSRPRPAPMPGGPLRIDRLADPSPEAYRQLFVRVGARWLWFSRAAMDDVALAAILHRPTTHVYAIRDPRGIEVGLLELDHAQAGVARIVFLGLVPELTGKGFGRWLMAQAVALGWRRDVACLAVDTCTLDHPAALPAYLRAGFTPVSRRVEVFADPRLAGLLPRDCAPQIPLIA